MTRRSTAIATAIALLALLCLHGLGVVFDGFVPLRGHRTIDGLLMSVAEGHFFALFAVVGMVAAVALAFAGLGLDRFSAYEWLASLPKRFSAKRWMLFFGLVAGLFSFAVAEALLRGSFITDDEMAMIFQAELLLEGRLWAPASPVPGILEYAVMIEEPRWFGMYPVGHPALIALSLGATGNPHVVPALLAAGIAALTFWLARRLFGHTTAVISGALLVLSPFFVLTTGTLASELSAGLFLLGAMNVAIRLDKKRPYLWASGLGLCVGAAFMCRPYTSVIVGLPLAYLAIRLWLKGRTPALSPLVSAASAIPFAGLYLWTTAEVTGSPWLSPYKINFPEMQLGLYQEMWGVIYTPEMALATVGLLLLSLNAWLLGWPLSVLPVACGLFLKRPRRRTLVIALVPLALVGGFFIVPGFSIQDTGPLYYFEIMPVLIIFSARGLVLLSRRLKPICQGRGKALITYGAMGSCLVGALFFVPPQVRMVSSMVAFNQAPYELAERVVEGKAIVFSRDMQTDPPSSWVLGNRPPHPSLEDRILYGKAPPRRSAEKALKQLPGRRGYYMSRDDEAGDISLVPLPIPASRP